MEFYCERNQLWGFNSQPKVNNWNPCNSSRQLLVIICYYYMYCLENEHFLFDCVTPYFSSSLACPYVNSFNYYVYYPVNIISLQSFFPFLTRLSLSERNITFYLSNLQFNWVSKFDPPMLQRREYGKSKVIIIYNSSATRNIMCS